MWSEEGMAESVTTWTDANEGVKEEADTDEVKCTPAAAGKTLTQTTRGVMAIRAENPILMAPQHPRDHRITFEAERHLYQVDGESGYVSASGVAALAFPGEFKARSVAKGMLASKAFGTLPKHRAYDGLLSTAKREGLGEEQVIDLIVAMWEKEQVLGTALHAFIETYYTGEAEVC